LSVNFRVEGESLEGVHAVNVIGELDQATTPELRRALDEAAGADGGAVLIDLSECGFIDSSGLTLLVEMRRRLAEDDRGFAVCCPRTEVRRLLELTGIDAAVGLFETRKDAVSSLGEAHS
jgi:anti-sigma B factor antagonist